MTAPARIPIDSTDARELREAEQDQVEHEAQARRAHAEMCRGGWLGEDGEGRPIACPTCRPWLARTPCRTCSVPWQACRRQVSAARGACCPDCEHRPDGRAAASAGGPHGAGLVLDESTATTLLDLLERASTTTTLPQALALEARTIACRLRAALGTITERTKP